MKRRNELEGTKFGKWTVGKFSHINKSRSAYWTCTCKCGSTKVVSALSLRKGESTQCRACAGKEKTSVYKQGDTREYLYVFRMHAYYKIGVSDNPEKRLAQINRTTPYSAEVILITKNKPGVEKLLHSMFLDKQVKGEWFVLRETDINLIEQTLACSSGSCEI